MHVIILRCTANPVFSVVVFSKSIFAFSNHFFGPVLWNGMILGRFSKFNLVAYNNVSPQDLPGLLTTQHDFDYRASRRLFALFSMQSEGCLFSCELLLVFLLISMDAA